MVVVLRIVMVLVLLLYILTVAFMVLLLVRMALSWEATSAAGGASAAECTPRNSPSLGAN